MIRGKRVSLTMMITNTMIMVILSTKRFDKFGSKMMTNSVILSAKELIEKMTLENPNITTEEMMIEFAKVHVRESLQAAHHAAVWELDGRAWDRVYNKRFLLQSYPDSKIV